VPPPAWQDNSGAAGKLFGSAFTPSQGQGQGQGGMGQGGMGQGGMGQGGMGQGGNST
jgi:general secretion pathway protein D